jgi:hypothetical protein
MLKKRLSFFCTLQAYYNPTNPTEQLEVSWQLPSAKKSLRSLLQRIMKDQMWL